MSARWAASIKASARAVAVRIGRSTRSASLVSCSSWRKARGQQMAKGPTTARDHSKRLCPAPS